MRSYQTISGDDWDIISKKVYGSEYHADLLMEANRAHIGTFTFSAGVKLTVPPLPDERDGGLPPWKFEANHV